MYFPENAFLSRVFALLMYVHCLPLIVPILKAKQFVSTYTHNDNEFSTCIHDDAHDRYRRRHVRSYCVTLFVKR